MATENRSILGSTELTSVDSDNDFIPIVDVSDTTDSAGGTTKKIKPKNLPASTATAAAIALVQADVDANETAANAAIALKQDKLITQSAVSGNYTLVLTDKDKFLVLSNGSSADLKIPNNTDVAFPTGTQISGCQGDAGQYTFIAMSGVTILCYNSRTKTTGQYACWTLFKTATNTWLLEGNLTT